MHCLISFLEFLSRSFDARFLVVLFVAFGCWQLVLYKRRCRLAKRASYTALTSVVCEKEPGGKAPCIAVDLSGHHYTGSLTRRNTPRISEDTPPPSYSVDDLGEDVKIAALQEYLSAFPKHALFRTQQAIKLSQLSKGQLNNLFVDLYSEIMQRSGFTSTHQILAMYPNLCDTRKEAIRRMESLSQDRFLEIAQDLLYEIDRRRRTTLTLAPPTILSRADVDWKGYNQKLFGAARHAAEGVYITKPNSARRPFDCYLFDNIFVAFRPGVVPVLKGRIVVSTIQEIEFWQGDRYYVKVLYAGDLSTPSIDHFVLEFDTLAMAHQWSTSLRDTVIRHQGK